jgi:ABC-type transporter Mla subunit MlaD
LARERDSGVQTREAVARLERDLAGVRGEADARSKTLSHTQAEIEKALEEAQRTLAETTEELAAATGALAKARQTQTDAEARAEEAIEAQRLLQEQLDAALGDVKTRSKTSSRSQTDLEKSLKGTQRTLAETVEALAESQEALKAADARWEVAEQQLAALREATAEPSTAPPSDAPTSASAAGEAAYTGPARSARRVTMPDGLEVQIDGIPAKMVDLSLTGAQILVPAAIKPNRAAKLAILYGPEPITCKGKIMWARLEPGMRDGKLWYRGGILFTSSDQAALQALIASQEQ